MTHDPLCPVGVKPWEDYYCCQICNPGETLPWERTCQCPLIAKVRADERQQEEARRMAKFGYWHDYRPELP